jgi:HTH-type transcriptional regulator/antitoxin HipB
MRDTAMNAILKLLNEPAPNNHGNPARKPVALQGLENIRRSLRDTNPAFRAAEVSQRGVEAFCAYVRDQLRRRRNALGLGQSQVGEKLNVSQSAISKMELGQGDLSLETLYEYAEVLGLRPAVIFIQTAEAIMEMTPSSSASGAIADESLSIPCFAFGAPAFEALQFGFLGSMLNCMPEIMSRSMPSMGSRLEQLSGSSATSKALQGLENIRRTLRQSNSAFEIAEASLKNAEAFSASVSNQLRQRRKAAGLDQSDIGEKLDVSQSAISKVELGQAELGLETLYEYAEALGLRPAVMFIQSARSIVDRMPCYGAPLDAAQEAIPAPIYAMEAAAVEVMQVALLQSVSGCMPGMMSEIVKQFA